MEQIEEKRYIKNVRRVVPYVAGEQPKKSGMVKLNTNECPYPPSPMVMDAMGTLQREEFRLYPDFNATVLVDALAEYNKVNPENIFVGVGSDDVLAMAFMTFFNGELPILFPDVTYSFYDVWANLYKIPYKTCALDEKWRLKKEDYFCENGGIIFPNPNAPTGVATSLASIEEIVKRNPDVVVIVDEAYIDFGGESALPLINKYDNLLVVQTFSKSRAMAGARIGVAFGDKKLIAYLNDVKFSFNSYTMNLPAQVLGAAAVKDDAYFKNIVQRI
ncbi:aminotransferase class I/II-fold pyridoxal phosphate-dependent enzyme, partial [Lachnospiraceae bacterium OttesenSCG-928-D06]|nr:aminotransferase class I/II-fold pyridoxal phosphate-dependent enzyme [Lachnospiraceae bacterium OttesenSCG-928-D06]